MEQRLYSVTHGDGRVQAWSSVRLPFEPKGWLRDYRSELQGALRATRATATSVLYAEYAAPDAAFADLENVLLYNVGSGCYSHLARRGIICRRMPSGDHLHHVTYASIESTDVIAPTGPVLAAARLVDTPSGGTPAHWWAAFRQHLHVPGRAPYVGVFGVRAEVGLAWRRTLAPSVKALLDGLVSALHVHDGSEHDHVTTALSEVGDGELLWALLNDPAIAIFGQRRLVRPHGPKIAWNPADERCGYIEVVRGTKDDPVTVTIVAL
ncbi:hypothetical protein [Nocardioides bizhenqiangii]|uniref:Uncharacterized protein n=1 Tax=Nocardioides bizhenqiangii TaxID=3095076 RepID=A0ABZ0ZMH7_9ACTN|nr:MULTISPECIES: hypothetical protein [unclassified Nocardioides]MDZ5621621.1 hypothetical protein [Nocardioides sp. HM23]WQQ25543.1 hypothetical protein SHK19_16430 [Nocardioides sp. HM61]